MSAMAKTTTFKGASIADCAPRDTVVIVEDDYVIAEDLRYMCEMAGWRVLGLIGRPKDAADRIRDLAPSHVLMDIRLGGRKDGIDIAQDVCRNNPTAKVIYVTASNDPDSLRRIRLSGGQPVLVKPITEAQLHAALAG